MRFMTGIPGNSIARFDSGFDHLLRGFLGIDENSQGVYSVHMDLVEGGDGFRIFVDLPGMEKDKIKQFYQEFLTDNKIWYKEVFNIISIEIWLRTYDKYLTPYENNDAI